MTLSPSSCAAAAARATTWSRRSSRCWARPARPPSGRGGSDPVDRFVRGADRARRAAGVGPSFPILGYDELNASQVQSRIKELKKPEMRKVLTYERKHANRKSVVGALEKSLA